MTAGWIARRLQFVPIWSRVLVGHSGPRGSKFRVGGLPRNVTLLSSSAKSRPNDPDTKWISGRKSALDGGQCALRLLAENKWFHLKKKQPRFISCSSDSPIDRRSPNKPELCSAFLTGGTAYPEQISL
jgi:hypothetical protein